jgi:Zn-dependent peptidase ImmA (M78 family)
MSFKLPDSVTVGGHEIKVKIGKLKKAHAEYDSDSYTVTIDSDTPADRVEMYLFHELVHAALHIGGVDQSLKIEQEEAVCWSLQHLLFPLYSRKKK